MYRQMPMYNVNQDSHVKQMIEWHTQMAQYEEQLRSFHLERATSFRQIAEKRQTSFAGNGTV